MFSLIVPSVMTETNHSGLDCILWYTQSLLYVVWAKLKAFVENNCATALKFIFICWGFNYFYCNKLLFLVDTKFSFLIKNIWKPGQFVSSCDMLRKIPLGCSQQLTLSFSVSVLLKSSPSCPLYSVLTSIISTSLINYFIPKSHLQSPARWCDIFGLSDSKESPVKC